MNVTFSWLKTWNEDELRATTPISNQTAATRGRVQRHRHPGAQFNNFVEISTDFSTEFSSTTTIKKLFGKVCWDFNKDIELTPSAPSCCSRSRSGGPCTTSPSRSRSCSGRRRGSTQRWEGKGFLLHSALSTCETTLSHFIWDYLCHTGQIVQKM